MKKYTFRVILAACALLNSSLSYAQGGIITTGAGCAVCIATPVDGVSAYIAELMNTTGVALDTSRNLYFADSGYSKVRMVVSSSNLVYTITGNGTAGFAGDGGPATAGMLNNPQGICFDAHNNLYIADAGNYRVRKINAATGIISTIAGGGVSTADGVAATTASLTPQCVYVDAAGNIYTGGSNKLRKVNAATGIITTIAGNGSATNSGDGGPATAAGIAGPIRSITQDIAGNIYIVPGSGDIVRKIDALTGTINTVAGGGPCTLDGAPATLALLMDMHSCVVDAAGDIIVADKGHALMRQVDAATGIIHTIAGGGSSLLDGIPALTALVDNYMLYMDATGGNIYYTDNNTLVRKLSYSPADYVSLATDSLHVDINKLCSGPQLTVTISHYIPGMNIKTWWGDASFDITPVSVLCSSTGGLTLTHSYANSGHYTIKQVLYSGTAPVDSFHITYEHRLCNSLYVSFYYDGNGNCVQDAAEPNIQLPIFTEVDSNGILVDTISATNGFYYTAYGNNGDIYQFKPHPVGGLTVTCPASGILADTLQSVVYNTKNTSFGLACGGGGFDLSVYAVVPVTGIHDQWGNIYVNNSSCVSSVATVTLTFSPKYSRTPEGSPTPSSVSGNTITWNLAGLTATAAHPIDLYYSLWAPSTAYLTPGDTVNERMVATPITGDSDPSNNQCEIIDTVRAGCDPNEMSVNPPACIHTASQQLQYTISFVNTGNDTAFNIYIMDTLSDDVDVQSVKVLMASHPMNTLLINAGGHNIYKFEFPNINLLDSAFSPSQCSGAVIFTVNTKSGLPVGTQVLNHAGIFFDDNGVVMTNTVMNTVCSPTAVPVVGNSNISVYPNPANDELTIKTDQTVYHSFIITNSLGQSLLQQDISAPQTTVNIQSLPAGLYYITFRGDNGQAVQKFVKM